MADRTKIEWAEASWSPITGCSPISEGCAHCYARKMAYRLRGRYGYPKDEPFRVTFHPDRLEQPLKWKKPRMIFVSSMGDLFHTDVPYWMTTEIFEVMKKAEWHTFLLLTKRPSHVMGWYHHEFSRYALQDNKHHEYFRNVWVGVTAENQKRADERIPILLQIPAAKHFVSVEPMLGAVDLSRWLPEPPEQIPFRLDSDVLQWVILGGETGSGARPMHPDWVRSVRDQCNRAKVPFFFKRWSEAYVQYNSRILHRHSGRLLDGKEWNERP